MPKRDGLMFSQLRLERQVVDVAQRVDGRVEAEPALGAGERVAQAVLEPRILDHYVGQLLGDGAVQLRIRREVHDRAAVVRLQVDDADAVELAQRAAAAGGPSPSRRRA